MTKDKLKVELRTLRRTMAYLSIIESVPLEEVIWLEDGQEVHPTDEQITDWKFTGLNNREFGLWFNSFGLTQQTNKNMTKLTAASVNEVFMDCLFRDGEDTSKAVTAQCVMSNFGFNPARLEINQSLIGEMLLCLPDEFHLDKGGGMSFLNACVTRDGDQWGQHQDIEQLLALGIATKQAKILLPRALWQSLPGGMPFFAVRAI
jgi:hypothetical protein